jgi:hypothetical protein
MHIYEVRPALGSSRRQDAALTATLPRPVVIGCLTQLNRRNRSVLLSLNFGVEDLK